MTLFFHKLFRFEYWPWKVFYAPLVPYYLYLSIKTRSLTFPSLVNSALENGGFFNENKKETLEALPSEYIPQSLYVSTETDFNELPLLIREKKILYPLIAKPLHLQRGKGVKIINSEPELREYFLEIKSDFVIQEFVELPIELAVFYSRLPGQKTGLVSSIAQKEFLSVTGNGHATINELLQNNIRARIVWNDLVKNNHFDPNVILPKDKQLIIEKIGNHCRGTIFRNATQYDKAKVAGVMDQILKNYDGFNYGRFDLKIGNEHDFYKGKNIKVLELNGVNADPAHIFDPDYKLFKAYNDVRWHWKRMAQIAHFNKKLGIKAFSFFKIFKKILKA